MEKSEQMTRPNEENNESELVDHASNRWTISVRIVYSTLQSSETLIITINNKFINFVCNVVAKDTAKNERLNFKQYSCLIKNIRQ